MNRLVPDTTTRLLSYFLRRGEPSWSARRLRVGWLSSNKTGGAVRRVEGGSGCAVKCAVINQMHNLSGSPILRLNSRCCVTTPTTITRSC